MLDNETTPQEAVITPKVLQKVKEFQDVYESGTIPEVLEQLKDTYSSNTDEDKDSRTGVLALVNHLRDLCDVIVQAPLEHLMV